MRRNWIVLILIIIGAGVLVGNVGGSISYLLFYSSIIIPALSLFYLWVVYEKFCIYQEIGTKVLVKEEQVPYLFKLANEDILSYTKIQVDFMKDLSSVENMDSSIEYCLLPRDEVHRATSLRCHYRGVYHVGIDHVTVTDYLNLFHVTYQCKSKIEVLVLPRVIHINQLTVAPESKDIKTSKYLIQTRNEVPDIEVRKYQSGDALRMIHWKATARSGNLFTRKYTQEPKTEMVLLLDLRRNQLKEVERIMIEDKILEAALAIADYFVRNHTSITVIFATPKLQRITINHMDDFSGFYEICSHIRFQSEVSSEELLKYTMQHPMGHQYCILLTATMNEALCRSSYQYVNMDNDLNVIMVSDENLTEQVKQLESRVKFYQVGLQQEVREVLEMEEP